MFTWICPQCGREVPPSYDECPDCAAKAKLAGAEPKVEAPPPGPVPATAPAASPQPYPPQPYPRRQPMPTWLMSILFALLFLGVGLGAYWLIDRGRNANQPAAQPPPLENVTAKNAKGKPHPLQKFLEVTGVRLMQGRKKD